MSKVQTSRGWDRNLQRKLDRATIDAWKDRKYRKHFSKYGAAWWFSPEKQARYLVVVLARQHGHNVLILTMTGKMFNVDNRFLNRTHGFPTKEGWPEIKQSAFIAKRKRKLLKKRKQAARGS